MCLVGVVVRRYNYRYPHIYYLSLLLLYLLFFAAASLLFVHFLNVFLSCSSKFCNLFLKNFVQYKQTYGRLRASHGSRMKGCACFIRENAHTNVRFISCDGHQLYDFKEHGVDLEVEDVRYIEMHHGPHMYWTRLLQGAEISN